MAQETKKPDLFTEEFARDLNKRLFGKVWSWAGTFRKTDKNVGVD
jgi:fido (protein-threonine AMPylation protein)